MDIRNELLINFKNLVASVDKIKESPALHQVYIKIQEAIFWAQKAIDIAEGKNDAN